MPRLIWVFAGCTLILLVLSCRGLNVLSSLKLHPLKRYCSLVLNCFAIHTIMHLLYFKPLVLVWFLFYGPSTHFRSFRARSVTLTTLFLRKPPRQFTSVSTHSFASNWQLLFLNQRKRENGRRNFFVTKSPRKNVLDVGIKLGASCMPSGCASDRATAPGIVINRENVLCDSNCIKLIFFLIIGKSVSQFKLISVWNIVRKCKATSHTVQPWEFCCHKSACTGTLQAGRMSETGLYWWCNK